MKELKSYRDLYEGKVRSDMFIPKEKEFVAYEKDLTVEVKEGNGCRIEFILKSGKVIAAMIEDKTFKIEYQKLNLNAAIKAYEDFDKWLQG